MVNKRDGRKEGMTTGWEVAFFLGRGGKERHHPPAQEVPGLGAFTFLFMIKLLPPNLERGWGYDFF